jgi:hypothetical protein
MMNVIRHGQGKDLSLTLHGSKIKNKLEKKKLNHHTDRVIKVGNPNYSPIPGDKLVLHHVESHHRLTLCDNH